MKTRKLQNKITDDWNKKQIKKQYEKNYEDKYEKENKRRNLLLRK